MHIDKHLWRICGELRRLVRERGALYRQTRDGMSYEEKSQLKSLDIHISALIWSYSKG